MNNLSYLVFLLKKKNTYSNILVVSFAKIYKHEGDMTLEKAPGCVYDRAVRGVHHRLAVWTDGSLAAASSVLELVSQHEICFLTASILPF